MLSSDSVLLNVKIQSIKQDIVGMLARLKYSKLESRPEYRMFMKMDGIRDQRHSNSELTELALFSQLGSTK